MKSTTILILALTLTACATCREHPKTCAAVAWVATSAVVLSATHGRNASSGTGGHDYTVTPANCQTGSCK